MLCGVWMSWALFLRSSAALISEMLLSNALLEMEHFKKSLIFCIEAPVLLVRAQNPHPLAFVYIRCVCVGACVALSVVHAAVDGDEENLLLFHHLKRWRERLEQRVEENDLLHNCKQREEEDVFVLLVQIEISVRNQAVCGDSEKWWHRRRR